MMQVNSFGFGGTNAVVILDDVYHFLESHSLHAFHQTLQQPTLLSNASTSLEPNGTAFPTDTYVHPSSSSGHSKLSNGWIPEARIRTLVWSAADESGIQRLVSGFRTFLDKYEANLSPATLDDVVYTLAVRRTKFPWRYHMTIESSEDLLRGSSQQSLKPTKALDNPCPAFVFTGQGSQYAQMGKQLMQNPIFEQSLRNSQEILSSIGCPWVLAGESGSI